MKYFLSFWFTFGIFATVLHAQKDTLWLDASWKKTSPEKAVYFRLKPVKKNNGYLFTDYYKSGAKQMEGISIDKDVPIYDGKVIWYFENGKPYQIAHYKKGILYGKWQEFYKNGKLKNEAIYTRDKFDGPYKYYYENGKLKESGLYKNDLREGLWKSYYKNARLKEEGYYKAGKRIKTWKTYYYNGENQDLELY